MLIFSPKPWRERESVVSTIRVLAHKNKGKSPPQTDDFFDGHLGVRTAAIQVREGNIFHSSGQASNSLAWEIDELKVSFFFLARQC